MVTQSSINTRKPIEVAQGGIGVATLTTAYAPVCAGTTATGPVQVASSGQNNAGYVLTSTGNASLPTWQPNAAGAAALVLLQTQTVTNVSTVTFTSGISSTYNTYLLIYDSVTTNAPGAGVNFLDVQISTNGGASYIASGYTFSTGAAGTASTALRLRTTTPGALSQYGTATIYNLTSGVGYISQICDASSVNSTTVVGTPTTYVSCYGTASTAVNALQVIISNPIYILSGNFSLYAYTK